MLLPINTHIVIFLASKRSKDNVCYFMKVGATLICTNLDELSKKNIR